MRDDTLRFSTDDGDDLYVPKGLAIGCLRAAGFGTPGVPLDYDEIVGATLDFSRLAPERAGGRPRWMIERTNALVRHPEPAAVATPSPTYTPPKDLHMDTGTKEKLAKREDLHAAYESALVTALQIQRKVFKGKLAPKVTAESVAASAATLFIQYERNRCL